METRYYLTCLWPGMAELWWRGRLTALPAAIAFALALNLLLVTRYIYPLWVSSGLVSMAFWIGAAAWFVYVVRSVRELPALVAPRVASDQPDRFPEAQAAYLKGNWAEAEALLKDVLAIEPRDSPALLLLTGVYRQTGRLESAELLLKEITRLEVADGWGLEVDAEARRLRQAIDDAQTTEPDNNTPASNADRESGPKAEESSADLTETARQAA